MSVIKVDNLSKKYTLHHQQTERYTALRDVIANKAKGLFNRRIVQPLKRLAISTISQFNISTSLPSSNLTIKPLYSLTLISHAIMLMMNPGRYGVNHRIIDAKMVELLSIS